MSFAGLHAGRHVHIIIFTHLPLDKMAAISQAIYSDAFLWMKRFCILIKISPKLVPKGPIDNNPALVKKMARAEWRLFCRGVGVLPSMCVA